MATNAQYVSTPVIEITLINTANTARDGTGTMSLVAAGITLAASAAGVGKRINRISVTANQTTTAGVVRFFGSLDSNATKRLVCEKLVPANTPSTSNPVVRFEVPELVGMVLPGTVGGLTAGLFASTNAGETFTVMVESGTL